MKAQLRWKWMPYALLIALPVALLALSIYRSKDCSQLVIDTYELHSGVNIPKVRYVHCYYDEPLQVRIAVYDLVGKMDFSKFDTVGNTQYPSILLHGAELLSRAESPQGAVLLRAMGQRWGTKWVYLVDPKTNRLWAELSY